MDATDTGAEACLPVLQEVLAECAEGTRLVPLNHSPSSCHVILSAWEPNAEASGRLTSVTHSASVGLKFCRYFSRRNGQRLAYAWAVWKAFKPMYITSSYFMKLTPVKGSTPQGVVARAIAPLIRMALATSEAFVNSAMDTAHRMM